MFFFRPKQPCLTSFRMYSHGYTAASPQHVSPQLQKLNFFPSTNKMGGAAGSARDKKDAKYHELAMTCTFVPIASETL